MLHPTTEDRASLTPQQHPQPCRLQPQPLRQPRRPQPQHPGLGRAPAGEIITADSVTYDLHHCHHHDLLTHVPPGPIRTHPHLAGVTAVVVAAAAAAVPPLTGSDGH